jgi:hypothetical protein
MSRQDSKSNKQHSDCAEQKGHAMLAAQLQISLLPNEYRAKWFTHSHNVYNTTGYLGKFHSSVPQPPISRPLLVCDKCLLVKKTSLPNVFSFLNSWENVIPKVEKLMS